MFSLVMQWTPLGVPLMFPKVKQDTFWKSMLVGSEKTESN